MYHTGPNTHIIDVYVFINVYHKFPFRMDLKQMSHWLSAVEASGHSFLPQRARP